MSQLAAEAEGRAAVSRPRERDRMAGDWVPVLAQVPLFRNLSQRHLKRVASLARTRRFSSGSLIVRAGDPGSTFYVLLDGTVRVVAPKGRPRRLKAGDFFGEMALFDDSPRSANVVAEDEVLTMTINCTAFRKLVRREPSLALELLRTLAARLRTAEKSA
jgi:CRP-like cAMP-binding protein